MNDYIYNPIESNSIFGKDAEIPTILIFSINLVYYLIYSALIVFILYSLFKAARNVIQSDREETYLKLRDGVTDAVLAAVGIVILYGIEFIPYIWLRLLGTTNWYSVWPF